MPLDPLTDEQREIRDLVRDLARERIAPRAAEIDESHEFPWDVVELYREHGLFGLFYPEEYGGLGTGALLALIAIEEVSKVCATSGVILAVQELGSLGLKLAGDDEGVKTYRPAPTRTETDRQGNSTVVYSTREEGIEGGVFPADAHAREAETGRTSHEDTHADNNAPTTLDTLADDQRSETGRHELRDDNK